jgi:uncharacterized protein YbjT (DUF2867 family)
MILVTGATGTVGTLVATQLVATGHATRALVRDTRRAKLPRSIEIAVGDFTDRDSLVAAMRGVDRMFLMDVSHDIDNTANVVAAAVASGVGHIVNLSSIGASLDPMPAMGRWHRHREDLIAASGIRCSFIRPSYFMSNTFAWATAVAGDGVVRQPGGDATFAPIDPGDIAAAAVALLLRPSATAGEHASVLTGPELLDLPTQVKILSEAVNRPLRYEDITDADVARSMQERGASPDLIDAVAELNSLLRSGALAVRTDEVAHITGRPAAPFRHWVRGHLDAFGVSDQPDSTSLR